MLCEIRFEHKEKLFDPFAYTANEPPVPTDKLPGTNMLTAFDFQYPDLSKASQELYLLLNYYDANADTKEARLIECVRIPLCDSEEYKKLISIKLDSHTKLIRIDGELINVSKLKTRCEAYDYEKLLSKAFSVEKRRDPCKADDFIAEELGVTPSFLKQALVNELKEAEEALHKIISDD